MKVQHPALPAQCWVSIIWRCSVAALYLYPSSLSRHYLISVHRQTLTESLSVRDPRGGWGRGGVGGRWLLKFYIFAFDYCSYSCGPLNGSSLANLQQGQTVWSAAGQAGGDIWGRGTLVPVRPHTDPMKDHRPERHGEQECDWAQTKRWKRHQATPCYHHPSTAWSQREPRRRRAGGDRRQSDLQALWSRGGGRRKQDWRSADGIAVLKQIYSKIWDYLMINNLINLMMWDDDEWAGVWESWETFISVRGFNNKLNEKVIFC